MPNRKGKMFPFGWQAGNRLTFGKSVNDKYSNLVKVLRYITIHGPTTRKNILLDVFHFHPRDFTNSRLTYNPNNRPSPNGWGSTLFSLAVRCGFLTHSRKGNTVIWSLGKNANKVKI